MEDAIIAEIVELIDVAASILYLKKEGSESNARNSD